jgi:iron complex outermembrane receptor protein
MRSLLLALVFPGLLFRAAEGQDNRSKLRGVVLDSTDSVGIVHAKLTLYTAQNPTVPVLFGATDALGEFDLPNILRGSYLLEVAAAGYNTQRDPVDVPAQFRRIYLTRKTFNLLPILVTAQIAANRQSPVTFSNLPDTVISNQFAYQDFPVMLSQLPSITEYSENGEGIGYSYVTMRGFDQRRISIMVNGIPQNDPEDHNVYWIDMPDLQASTKDIQVQRGAGNEFYGAPAIGGSINLQTTNLTNERELDFSAGLGSTGSGGMVRRYSTTLASGLIGRKYSFYAHLARTTTDGYRQNSWIDLNSYFLSASRFDDNLTTEVNVYGGPISDGLAYLGLPKFAALDSKLRTSNWSDWNPDPTNVNYTPRMIQVVSHNGTDTVYAVPRRSSELENFYQQHYELINEWKVSPSTTLNNSFFAIYGSGFFDDDGSWADTSFFRIDSQYGFHPMANPSEALIRAYVDLKQYGWIPRLTLNHHAGTLVLGAELDENFSDHWQTIRWAQDLAPDVPPDYRYNEWHALTDVASAYGHELYEIDQRLTLMLDLEYEFKQYRFYNEKFVGYSFIVPYHFFNPRAGLNYNFSRESNAYLSISQTSREPQLASLYNADESSYHAGSESLRATPNFARTLTGTYNFGDPLIKPEKLTDFELGYHYTSGGITVGLTGYWMEFYDELVSNGILDQYGQPVDGNAQRTRHMGLEIEASMPVTSGLSFYGNLSLSRNRIIHYIYYESQTDSVGNSVPIPDTLDGNRLGGFPEILGNIRANYALNGLSIVLLGQYIGSQYTDNFQSSLHEIDSYFILNGWISYRVRKILSLSSIELKFYCNNLLNKLYIAHGEGEYFYPAATRNFFFNLSISL